MRFTITMDDELVQRIDDDAKKHGVSRAGWITTTSHQALQASGADGGDAAASGELITLRAKSSYQDELIKHLTEDRTWLQGECSRLQQHNDVLMHRLLPSPDDEQVRPGAVTRFKNWLKG